MDNWQSPVNGIAAVEGHLFGVPRRCGFSGSPSSIEKKFANGGIYSFTYDNANCLATRTDSLDQVTTFAYFKDNNLMS